MFNFIYPLFFSLECLMSCGNKLISPKLRAGQELDANLIHKIYKSKALYIRPSRQILVSNISRHHLIIAMLLMLIMFRKLVMEEHFESN